MPVPCRDVPLRATAGTVPPPAPHRHRGRARHRHRHRDLAAARPTTAPRAACRPPPPSVWSATHHGFAHVQHRQRVRGRPPPRARRARRLPVTAGSRRDSPRRDPALDSCCPATASAWRHRAGRSSPVLVRRDRRHPPRPALALVADSLPAPSRPSWDAGAERQVGDNRGRAGDADHHRGSPRNGAISCRHRIAQLITLPWCSPASRRRRTPFGRAKRP